MLCVVLNISKSKHVTNNSLYEDAKGEPEGSSQENETSGTLSKAVVPKVGVGTPLGVTRDFRWGPQNDFQNIVA